MKEKKYFFREEPKKYIKNKDIIEKEENSLNEETQLHHRQFRRTYYKMMDNKNEEKEDEIKEKVKEPKREYKKRTIYKNILKENDEDLEIYQRINRETLQKKIL